MFAASLSCENHISLTKSTIMCSENKASLFFQLIQESFSLVYLAWEEFCTIHKGTLQTSLYHLKTFHYPAFVGHVWDVCKHTFLETNGELSYSRCPQPHFSLVGKIHLTDIETAAKEFNPIWLDFKSIYSITLPLMDTHKHTHTHTHTHPYTGKIVHVLLRLQSHFTVCSLPTQRPPGGI